MTRAEALKLALENVEKLATNVRGYQDGIRFPDKVAAVESLARFLLEQEADQLQAVTNPVYEITPERRNLLVYLANFQLDNGPGEHDADAATLLNVLAAL